MAENSGTETRADSSESGRVPGAPAKAQNFGWAAWTIYIIGAARERWQWGLLGGLIAMLVIIGIEYRHRAVKIPDAVSLGFFTMMLAVTIIAGSWVIADYSVLIVWSVFAIVFWATILIGSPFALQYAREMAPIAIWNHPIFMRMNYLISLLWAVTCTVNAILGFAMLKSEHAFIIGIVIPTALMVFAYAAGGWYGKRTGAKFQNSIGPAAAQGEAHG